VIQNETNETKNKVDKSHGAKKCYLIQIIIIIIIIIILLTHS
jgi:t-SNARE complex subunit (syntaxin)